MLLIGVIMSGASGCERGVRNERRPTPHSKYHNEKYVVKLTSGKQNFVS